MVLFESTKLLIAYKLEMWSDLCSVFRDKNLCLIHYSPTIQSARRAEIKSYSDTNHFEAHLLTLHYYCQLKTVRTELNLKFSLSTFSIDPGSSDS